MKYFDPWTILTSSDDTNCYTKDICMLTLGINNGQGMGQIWITEDRENSPKIMYQCKCDTLKDYVRYVYTNTIFQFYNFSFINDNQTIISENKSAIQLEYELSLDDIQVHALTIFTKCNDSFYQFTLYAIPSSFSKYLNDFKQMVNSLEFVSSFKNETKKKQQQPSFMSDIDETNNNKTSIFIEEKENAQDLLNVDNKKKQQQQKQKLQEQQQQQKIQEEHQQQQLKQQQQKIQQQKIKQQK
jgi:hypothetical protein